LTDRIHGNKTTVFELEPVLQYSGIDDGSSSFDFSVSRGIGFAQLARQGLCKPTNHAFFSCSIESAPLTIYSAQDRCSLNATIC